MHRLPHIGSTLSVLAIGLFLLSMSGQSPRVASIPLDDDDLVGLDSAVQVSHRPTVEAAFALQGYRPGEIARLRFFSRAENVSLEIAHGGTESIRIIRNDVMAGQAVRASRHIGAVRPGRDLSITLGNWPSGLYFARLTAAGGRVGYAPFVLEPQKLGEPVWLSGFGLRRT